MATVEASRERLKDTFTAEQADVLAQVVVEVHAEYVTRGDFHALTSVVKDLAAAQQRTEMRMEKLSQAQQELAESQQELAKAQKELAWVMKDTRKQLGGLAQSAGYGLEAYAMERIPRILCRQMRFVEEASGPEQFVSASGLEDDVDVVVCGPLAGRPVVFLCEAKTNITP